MPTPSSDRIVDASRLTVSVNGTPAPRLAADLVGLLVTRRFNLPAEMMLTVLTPRDRRNRLDPAGHVRDGLIDFGKTVKVSLGRTETLFEGVIVALEHSFSDGAVPTISVTALDRLDEWHHPLRSRLFEHMGFTDLIQTLASEHGQRVVPRGLGRQVFPSITQFNESNLDLIQGIAAETNLVFWYEENALQARPRIPADESDVELKFGQGLIHFNAEISLVSQFSAVTVSGWDPRKKRGIEAEAGLPKPDPGCRSGAQVLLNTSGPRQLRLLTGQPSAESAGRVARAARDKRHQRFIAARGTVHGTGELKLGRKASVLGMGPPLDESYHVTALQHRFELEDGLTTHFSAERSCYRPPRKKSHANPNRRTSPRPPTG